MQRITGIEYGSLVGGETWGGGPSPEAGWLESFDPWSGQVIGRCATADWSVCDRALDLATHAWETPPPVAERAQVAARAARAVARSQADLIGLLIRETGKPKTFAQGEVGRLELTFRLASELAFEMTDRPLDTSFDPRGKDFDAKWARFPVGPVLAFVPYNWPFNLAAHKIAPALIAGCPVILKVSPLAPLCSFMLAQLLIEAGMPQGFLSVLHMPNDLAQRVLKDDRVKMLSFTGSPGVGWMLKELVPKKRVLLEMGGNAPVIVEPDADLELAAERTALSGFGYGGQVCISAQNVFAHSEVYEEVLSRLSEATRDCPTGDPAMDAIVCGPLIDESAAQKVKSKVDDALAKGAVIASQAKVEQRPNLYPPTLLANVPKGAEAFAEEIFGPVLTVSRYDSLDEVIAMLNRGNYRLQASLFSNSQQTAEYVFRRLRYGGVVWNESPSLRFDNMPYGGEGDSGFGREGVRFAIEEMTAPRSFVWRR